MLWYYVSYHFLAWSFRKAKHDTFVPSWRFDLPGGLANEFRNTKTAEAQPSPEFTPASLLLNPDFTPQLSVGTSSTVYAAEPIAKYYTKIKKKSTIGG